MTQRPDSNGLADPPDPDDLPEAPQPEQSGEDSALEIPAEADELSEEGLIAYLADHIQRAVDAVKTKPAGDPVRTLALGGAVELFNLAEQFGLIADVRELADERTGANTFALVSQAMQALLRPGRPPPGGAGGGWPRRGRPPPRR